MFEMSPIIRLLIVCITLLTISTNSKATSYIKLYTWPDNLESNKTITAHWPERWAPIITDEPSQVYSGDIDISIVDTSDQSNLYDCHTSIQPAYLDTIGLGLVKIQRMPGNKFIVHMKDYKRKAEDAPYDYTYADLIPADTLRILDNCTVVKTIVFGQKDQVLDISKHSLLIKLVTYEDGFDVIYADGRRENDKVHYENYDVNGDKIGEHLVLQKQAMFTGTLISGKSRKQGFTFKNGYHFDSNSGISQLENDKTIVPEK